VFKHHFHVFITQTKIKQRLCTFYLLINAFFVKQLNVIV
jgi:hypothetical protein